MHVVSVLYPRTETRADFNLDHYISIHLKLGFRLMQKHYGVVPISALVQHSTRGMDNTPASSPYLAICWVCFRSREEADLFVQIFQIEEAATALTADWCNYCPAPPRIVIGEVLELKGEDIIEGSEEVLRRLGIQLTK